MAQPSAQAKRAPLQAHFFARELESDADILGTCRYVARNPVDAGLVTDPLAWRWSSAAATAGLEKPRLPLDLEPLRAALGGGADWRRRYRELIEGAESAEGRWS